MCFASLSLQYKMETGCIWSLFAPQVKLSGVDLSGIIDGVPSVVLNLIWSIILHFQAGPKHQWVIFACYPCCLLVSKTGETGGARSERSPVFKQLFLKAITPGGARQWWQQQLLLSSCANNRQKGWCGVKTSWQNNQDSAAAGPNVHVKVSLKEIC